MKAQTVTLGEMAIAAGRTKRALEIRATRESWPHTTEAVRGGQRRLYLVEGLPEDVRLRVYAHQSAQALLRHGLGGTAPATPKVAIATPKVATPALPAPSGEPTRAGMPSPAHTSTAATGAGGFTPGALAVRADVDQGVALGVTAALGSLGTALDKTALACLSAKQSEVQKQAHAAQQRLGLLAYPVLFKASVAAGMGEEVAKKACKLPRRFVEAERRFAMIATYDKDGKAFYDRHITPVARQRVNLQPGQIVFGDVSPADIPVFRADGSVGWARLIAWQDAATNMLHITGYLADKGSSVRREHIALAFGAMAHESPFGLPQKLYLDNGSEYNWAHMFDVWRELGQLTGGAFGGAWAENELPERERAGFIHRSIPFKPRAKSIEGQFSNLQRFLGWMPGFAGGDRLRKKVATLGKGVEPITLQALKDGIGAALAYYHGVPQEGHLGGLSPVQKMEEFLNAGFAPVKVDQDALALAFAERHDCKVNAGMVRVGSWDYMHPALHQHAGRNLQVRWARHMPDCAYVFDGTRPLCVAMAAPVYAFADKAGAEHAGRLAKEARHAVSVMRGQVAWLDPRDLMGEFAKLQGVDNVIAMADSRATRIATLSPEAQALADQRQAHMLQAVDKLLTQKTQLLDRRFDHSVNPDEEEARALFG